MRFYLHNEVKEDALYFCPRKTNENNRIATYIVDSENVYPQEWEKYLDLDKKIYSSHPCQRHAWALTSTRAAHGIEAFEYDRCARVTFLVHSHRPSVNHNAWNPDKLYDLLTRSLDKYSDYAIWWESTK